MQGVLTGGIFLCSAALAWDPAKAPLKLEGRIALWNDLTITIDMHQSAPRFLRVGNWNGLFVFSNAPFRIYIRHSTPLFDEGIESMQMQSDH